MGNFISNRKRQAVHQLLKSGASVRAICKITGVHCMTVHRHKRAMDRREVPDFTPTVTDGGCCWCGAEITTKKEADRRTRRTTLKFCDHGCYSAYYRAKRGTDTCKRCGIQRRQLLCGMFSRGYCQRCYGLLRQFNWDEGLADVHDSIRTLKKELRT